VFVADGGNHAIRRITPSGDVTTFAGTLGSSGAQDGNGSTARFNSPAALGLDALGNIYVADRNNGTVRKITPSADVTTVAGNAGNTATATNGYGKGVTFNNIYGLTTDASGNCYIAESSVHIIRRMTAGGPIPGATNSTYMLTATGGFSTGNYYCDVTESGSTVTSQLANVFVKPEILTQSSSTSLVAGGTLSMSVVPAGSDAVQYRWRKRGAATVSTLAGSGTSGGADGVGGGATFAAPIGVAVDAIGNVYVADALGHKIRKVSPVGAVTTLAGSGAGSTNGSGSGASFNSPRGVAVDGAGNVYVADYSNNRIRKVTATGDVTTFAGSGSSGSSDGSAGSATFHGPVGVAVDSVGNVYVADEANNRDSKDHAGRNC